MTRAQLEKDEIGDFYWRYINLIPENAELIQVLRNNTDEIVAFLEEIPEDKWSFKYAPDKWTILEMIQHIIDTERIFQYRALCFARNEKNALPGYDHDAYAPASKAGNRTSEDLINEFKVVRESGILLFRSFTDEMLQLNGSMNGVAATPRAIGFIIPGHALHHMDIISKRYL